MNLLFSYRGDGSISYFVNTVFPLFWNSLLSLIQVASTKYPFLLSWTPWIDLLS
jgi:hypothetical protein